MVLRVAYVSRLCNKQARYLAKMFGFALDSPLHDLVSALVLTSQSYERIYAYLQNVITTITFFATAKHLQFVKS